MTAQKSHLRRKYRDLRRQRRAVSSADARLSEQLSLSQRWREVLDLAEVDDYAQDFLPAFYAPLDAEPDISPLLTLYSRCLLPLMCNDDGTTFDEPAWALFAPGQFLEKPSEQWPSQPRGSAVASTMLDKVSLWCVPAVAVDMSGTRLGRGGGWYDRTLVHRGNAPVVAVAFDDEVEDAGVLPRESHDQPVDFIVTPTRVLTLPHT